VLLHDAPTWPPADWDCTAAVDCTAATCRYGKYEDKYEKKYEDKYEDKYEKKYEDKYEDKYEKKYDDKYEKKYDDKYEKKYDDKVRTQYIGLGCLYSAVQSTAVLHRSLPAPQVVDDTRCAQHLLVAFCLCHRPAQLHAQLPSVSAIGLHSCMHIGLHSCMVVWK
jgi:hypothetical protein